MFNFIGFNGFIVDLRCKAHANNRIVLNESKITSGCGKL